MSNLSDKGGLKDSANPAALEVRNLRFGYGAAAIPLMDDISFSVRPGEFISIVGPSGCGKTTLLKLVAGLIRPQSGERFLNGSPVVGTPPDLAFVFQDYTRSLLPWATILHNVTFPLRAKGVGKQERDEQGRAALAAVDLHGVDNDYPWQLSGGMQQRVAIARALAYRPSVLLMDEPFASLDAQVRADLEDLTLRIQHETGVTTVLVTHDIDEAIYLGHRVFTLSKRPTVLRRVFDVPLGFPRDQLTTRAEPAFLELRAEITKLIRNSADDARKDRN